MVVSDPADNAWPATIKGIMATQVPCTKHIQYISYCDDCKAASQEDAAIEQAEFDKHNKVFNTLQQKGRYIYVKADSAQDLVIRVNEKMEKGFKPLGAPNIVVAPYISGGGGGGGFPPPPIFITTTVSTSYMQFMVRDTK